MSGTRFGLYIHWPFCLSKCPYCDFNSHVAERIDQTAWREALLRELDEGAERTQGRTVTSVFFGGGTPSLMDPATTAALIERIGQRWSLADDIEITLEANPGTVDAERFREIRGAGVNRLSMGLQALDDSQLKFLGRVHDSAQAIRAVELARAIFPRISFDLIYARPGQSLESWRAELQRAIAMAADHLSLYQLTIEPGTAFHPMAARGDFVMPDDDHAAALFDLTQEVTEAAGLPAYEISNHARPGAECRHNLLYWQGDDFLGIGPGAHGRLTDEAGRTTTHRRHRAPESWRGMVLERGEGTADSGVLSEEDRVTELVMMGLRLSEGLSLAKFPALEAALDPEGLAGMIEDGFLEKRDGFLRATSKGRLLLNGVIERLLP
ncbi:MAG TPA: radical SAM family heme chaperone HemW [Magnetospirillaceae bacterium]|nr:radical SAM family heme chaperone HemW [Magnetospirillaceae bacterium]